MCLITSHICCSSFGTCVHWFWSILVSVWSTEGRGLGKGAETQPRPGSLMSSYSELKCSAGFQKWWVPELPDISSDKITDSVGKEMQWIKTLCFSKAFKAHCVRQFSSGGDKYKKCENWLIGRAVSFVWGRDCLVREELEIRRSQGATWDRSLALFSVMVRYKMK